MKVKIRQSGFSMIELLVALTILAVGILAIAQLQVAAISTLTFSRHMTTATQLAQEQLEFLRTLPVPNTNSTGDFPKNNLGDDIKDADNLPPLYDDTSGGGDAALSDGLPSNWHRLSVGPVNEHGLPASADEMKYYVRWRITRCCKQTPPLDNNGLGHYDPSTHILDVPGGSQIVILMQVIWWESNKRKPASIDLQTLDQSVIRATNGHLVEMTTIRTTNL